jgi:tRNA pseudouridine38-40 synthase
MDIEKIKKAITYFIGEHDFKNISVNNSIDKPAQDEMLITPKIEVNTICKIYDLSLTTDYFDIIIKVEANRFLRKMVRGLIGFLVDVGRGRFNPEHSMQVFSKGLKGIYFAPPQGLFLIEVKY